MDEQKAVREEVKILFDSNAMELMSFVQYVKFMKDPEVINQVMDIIIEKFPSLS